jgi:hypothetical protein
MHARGIACAALLLLALAAAPSFATNAVVPDSFPTVQAGIDSGRDTVFVKSGRFDEDLVVGRALALLAYPPSNSYDETALPQVGSLTFPAPCPLDSSCGGDFVVRGFRFRGPVRLTGPGQSSTYDVRFETCRMDSGLSGAGLNVNILVLNVSGCTVLIGMTTCTSAPDRRC